VDGNSAPSTTRRGLVAGGAAALLGGCLGSPGGDSDGCSTTAAGRADDPGSADGDAGTATGSTEGGGEAPDARLGFVGDLMLGRNVDEARAEDQPAAVWGSVHERLRDLDGVVANLEGCLSTRGEPRPGRTYHFRADPAWAVPALRAGNVAACALANNHLLDFGPAALRDTLAALSAGDVAAAGAGVDRAAATAPATFDVGGVRVALLSLTDQAPAYAAGVGTPGVANVPLDARSRHARRLVDVGLTRVRAADPDLVVASLHWGPNWVAVPDAGYRAFGRWLIEQGVDVVHGHSAHVVQGVETHAGGLLLHDCGDFVDDYVVKPELRNDRSFLFEVSVADGRPTRLRLVPVVIRGRAVHAADGGEAAWLRGAIRERSSTFDTEFERAGEGLVVDVDDC